MSQCGMIEFLDGATLQRPNILNAEILGGNINGSKLTGVKVENLGAIDEASAQVIADTLAGLPPAKLAALAQAILDQLQTKAGPTPAFTEGEHVSTKVVGNRDYTLGRPDAWVEAPDGSSIPAYRKP